jgi:competence protein CoiA
MLTAIRASDGRKVGAWEAEKGERPFECFCCRRVVTLRKGRVVAPHFAHQPPVVCEYGAGESEEHRRCKLALYDALARDPRAEKCELERDLGTVRPDVSAYVRGVPVAFEVQLSNLPLEKIIYRTSEYFRKKINVLWLPVAHAGLRRELYRPRPWEAWLHALQFGRVYYWLEGARVLPVTFRDYYTTVRGRTRDFRQLSRMKVPVAGRQLSLLEDFAPAERPAWSGGRLSLPAARLFVEAGTRPR